MPSCLSLSRSILNGKLQYALKRISEKSKLGSGLHLWCASYWCLQVFESMISFTTDIQSVLPRVRQKEKAVNLNRLEDQPASRPSYILLYLCTSSRISSFCCSKLSVRKKAWRVSNSVTGMLFALRLAICSRIRWMSKPRPFFRRAFLK